MRPTIALVVAALLAVPASAAAKQRPITGSIAANGFTVLALSYDGKASSVVVRAGKFRIVPPAGKVTLSLRNSKGQYAGPIVVGRKGKKAALGVRAGAAL